MRRLGSIIAYVSEQFKSVLDRGGSPYILHCLHVMNEVKHLGESAMICAILHDTLEDIEDEDLRSQLNQLGVTDEEMLILDLLIHHKEDTHYEKYIADLSAHPIAREIKKADLRHNMDITRLKSISHNTAERLIKYHNAYKFLNRL